MDYEKQLEHFRRRRERMLFLLREGFSKAAVARRFKITPQRVAQIVSNANGKK